MIRRLLATCACLAALSTMALAETAAPKAAKTAAPVSVEEPRDIVAAVYKRAALDSKKPNADSPFTSREVRERYFSKSFDLLVTTAETKAAHGGDAALDFDPISASQDAELQKVTLKTDVLELGKAVVSASFSNHGQPTVVTYDFTKEDGEWKINDIKGTTDKEAWSVRKILTASGKPPKSLPGSDKDEAKPKPSAK